MKYIFETERLFVREIVPDDHQFVIDILNSEGWINNIGDRNVKSKHQALAYINTKVIIDYKKSGFGMYVFGLKENNQLIGMTGLVDREGLDGIDIGFAILPEFYRQGYTYEASLPILQHAKEKNIEKLLAITIVENIGSRKLLEKLGFDFVKEFYLQDDPALLACYELELTQ